MKRPQGFTAPTKNIYEGWLVGLFGGGSGGRDFQLRIKRVTARIRERERESEKDFMTNV